MKKLYTDLNNDCPLFSCYSINLYRYLKNNGLRYERKKVVECADGTEKTCWMFKRTEAFEFLYKKFGEEKDKALKRTSEEESSSS